MFGKNSRRYSFIHSITPRKEFRLRNLDFNLKNAEDVEHDGPEGGSNEDFGRVTFVWLPEDLKKLRTIKLTFHRFFGEDDEEQLVDPIAPNRERLLIRT